MAWQHFDSYGCDSDNLGLNASLYFDQFEFWHLLKLKLSREKNLAANTEPLETKRRAVRGECRGALMWNPPARKKRTWEQQETDKLLSLLCQRKACRSELRAITGIHLLALSHTL